MSMMRGGPAAAARGGGPGPGHGPFGRMGAPGGTATNAKAAAGRLLQRLDRQRRVLFLVLFLTAAATGTGLLGPKLLGDATTHVFNGLIGSKLPAGMDKATIVAGLRAQGKTRFADMLVGAGTATLDVTDLATTLGPDDTVVVRAHVAMGVLNIYLPDEMHARGHITTSVRMGSLEGDDQPKLDGFGQARDWEYGNAGPTIDIEADVDMGQIIVHTAEENS